MKGLRRADHQVETAFPAIQVPKQRLGVDPQSLENGWNLVRDLAPLAGMNSAAAPVQ